VIPGEVVGADGFQLSITLSKLHLPRMWVENHPDKDSQVSVLPVCLPVYLSVRSVLSRCLACSGCVLFKQ